MPADTSVKYFHSAMPGAPVLSGTAGSLINVLDACLVNGFGVSAVASLVVAGGVATATISGGHSGEVGSVMLVAGATPSGLNGEKKLLSVGAGNTTLTFDATGISDQTATGSITVKMAGAGWLKSFSGTNLAAYKSGDVAASQCLLRVDDTAAKVARVVGYESMTGISAGTGPFPTATQRSGGTFWAKSNVADGSGRLWVLVADTRMAYLIMRYHSSYTTSTNFVAFGDLLSVKSGDAWGCVLSGYSSDLSGSAPGDANDYGTMRAAGGADELFLARSHTALGGSCRANKSFAIPILPSASTAFASGSGPQRYPNGPDSGIWVGPHYISESTDQSIRGMSPGFFCCPQWVPYDWVAFNFSMTGVSQLPGRELRVNTFGADIAALCGFAFFDVTGPWR